MWKINGPEKNYGEIKSDKIIVNWGQALALHGGHYSKVLKKQQSDQQKCKNDNYFMTSQALLGTATKLAHGKNVYSNKT